MVFCTWCFRKARWCQQSSHPCSKGNLREYCTTVTVGTTVTVPMSNAAKERWFSCLRRLRNYLTNKPNQENVNRRMFLRNDKHLIDQVDLVTILQEFTAVN